MNKINFCKSACFVVLNLYYTGCLLRICSVVRFLGEGLLCNRGFAAKLFFKRYIAVVIGRSPWRRPGIVFDNKASLVGQVFRFGIGSLLCRFSAKKRLIPFVLYSKTIRRRVLTADKTASAACAKLLFKAVLATAYCAHKLHLSLRSGGILPASGRVFNGGIINRGHLFKNRVSYLRRYAVCRF